MSSSTSPRSPLLRAAPLFLSALAFAACDGKIITFSEADELGVDSEDASPPSDDVLDASVESSSPPIDAPASGAFGCQVVKVVATPLGDSGAVSYGRTLVNGDSTTMEHVGDQRFTVTCRDGATELMRVTFGPYTGFTDYPVAVGDLVLHGQASDRPCTVSLSSAHPAIRGFLSCEVEPYSDGNIFSLTAAPVGLGAFDVLAP
ncbi:MAG: hypothetical protein KF782_24175 [Labilithrix sp.]|nr:hypothetical protein [Labilithrix sp.]